MLTGGFNRNGKIRFIFHFRESRNLAIAGKSNQVIASCSFRRFIILAGITSLLPAG